MFSSTVSRMSSYKDILRLVLKYGHADVIEQSDLRSQLGEPQESEAGSGKPEELAKDLEQMGPAFVKLGQLLSTRSDMLPRPYLEALSRLQDDVEPLSFEELEQVVCSELEASIDDVFDEFERKPLASASLGQVHRAVLRNGRPVAVKVQRPDIIDGLENDIAALKKIAAMLEKMTDAGKRFRFSRMMETLERTLTRELDYRLEARHARAFAANLDEFDNLVVPGVVDELSTRRVLTMELVPGKKVTELGRLELLEIDRKGLVTELFRAYLKQILVDGVFHADPHPGNLVLTEDHKIALLDFGMVENISPRDRDSLMKLLLSIGEGRGDDAAAAAIQLGSPDEEFDAAEFTERISRVVSHHQNMPVEQIRTGATVMEIRRIAADTGILLTDSLTMLGKTLLNLDRVVETLDPDFDPNEAIRNECTDLMQRRTKDNFSLGKLYKTALDTNELMQAFPERLNKITSLIADNKLHVDVDAIDEKYMMKGLQKIANRITVGVILGALIVGAAMMMHLETSWTLFGYPGLAITFFLVAAFAGLYMVFHILFKDES